MRQQEPQPSIPTDPLLKDLDLNLEINPDAAPSPDLENPNGVSLIRTMVYPADAIRKNSLTPAEVRSRLLLAMRDSLVASNANPDDFTYTSIVNALGDVTITATARLKDTSAFGRKPVINTTDVNPLLRKAVKKS